MHQLSGISEKGVDWIIAYEQRGIVMAVAVQSILRKIRAERTVPPRHL